MGTVIQSIPMRDTNLLTDAKCFFSDQYKQISEIRKRCRKTETGALSSNPLSISTQGHNHEMLKAIIKVLEALKDSIQYNFNYKRDLYHKLSKENEDHRYIFELAPLANAQVRSKKNLIESGFFLERQLKAIQELINGAEEVKKVLKPFPEANQSYFWSALTTATVIIASGIASYFKF